MGRVLKIIVVVGSLLTGLAGLDRARLVGAEEETKFSHPKRGGILVAAEGYRFEVFFYRTGVRVFPLDNAGNAVDASRLTASATFYHSNAPREPWFSRPLHPDPTDTGNEPSSLVLSIGLAKVPEKATTVAFEVIGLSGPTASTATFRVPLEFVAKAADTDTNISSEPRKIARLGYEGNRPDVVSEPRTLPQPADRPDVVFEPRTLPQPAEDTPAYVGTRMDSGSNTSKNATTEGLMRRDWTTGRDNLPLARPWLPMR
ncbi:MAG: hypothetical protein JO344_22380 [Planctomycetaceae bacterium]|nr:hypothetical protein [Planctomycetaceae bacterium]